MLLELPGLDNAQSAGIREILGIAGDEATVERCEGADRAHGYVGLPYSEAFVHTRLDQFVFRYDKGGYYFIGKVPANGLREFIEITNGQITIAGNPLRASLPPTRLEKLLARIVGTAPQLVAARVERIDPEEKRASEIFVAARSMTEKVFHAINARAGEWLEEPIAKPTQKNPKKRFNIFAMVRNAAKEFNRSIDRKIDQQMNDILLTQGQIKPAEPKQKPSKKIRKWHLDCEQANRIFKGLGYAAKHSEQVIPGVIEVQEDQFGVVVKGKAPSAYGDCINHLPARFVVEQGDGGRAHVEFEDTKADKNIDLILDPASSNKGKDQMQADALFARRVTALVMSEVSSSAPLQPR